MLAAALRLTVSVRWRQHKPDLWFLLCNCNVVVLPHSFTSGLVGVIWWVSLSTADPWDCAAVLWEQHPEMCHCLHGGPFGSRSYPCTLPGSNGRRFRRCLSLKFVQAWCRQWIKDN